MLGIRILLTYLCLAFTIPIALSAPALSNGLGPPRLLQHTSATNPSNSGFESRSSNFYIPNSRYILKLQLGKAIDPSALRALLAVANASVADDIARYGRYHRSNLNYLHPFAYDLGDGVELRIVNSVHPNGFTWGQLQTIIRGLWLFQVEGQRNKRSSFDILDITPVQGAILVGWGTLQKPMPKTLIEYPTLNSTAIAKREVQGITRSDIVPLNQSTTSSNVFPIPSSRNKLEFHDFDELLHLSAVKILLAVISAVIKEGIEAYGVDSHFPKRSFEYGLGDGVELRIWQTPFPKGLTWNILQTIVNGLWMYYIQQTKELREARFRVLVDANDFEIGFGVIRKPIAPTSPTPKNTTEFYRRSGYATGSLISKGLNTSLLDSKTFNSSLSGPNIFSLQLDGGPRRFPIPHTELTLGIFSRGPLIDHTVMENLLLEANQLIYNQIDYHGENVPMTGSSFRHRDEGSGIALELLSARPPQKRLTWGQLANVLEGISLYIVERQDYRACYITIFAGEPEVEIGLGKISFSIIQPQHNLSTDTA